LTDAISAVAIDTCGEYGNHFVQLMTALAFCLVTKVRFIYVGSRFLWLWGRNISTRNGIQVVTTESPAGLPLPREHVVHGGWWLPDYWCGDFSWAYLALQVREPLLCALPPVSVDPDALLLYLRGGQEVWNQSHGVNQNYAQPPCSFYLDAMRNFTKVQAIGGDLHPCRDVVIRAGASWQPYNDMLDMSRMVYARHIALARSSRSHAVLALSPFPKNFWVFDQLTELELERPWWRGYSPLMFGQGMNCRPSDHFRKVVFPWLASPIQVEFVLHGNCSWEPVPCAPGVELTSVRDRFYHDEPV
jgi:hypothetical protein